MRPARGNLLVREVETSETLPGGRIVLPEQVREHFSAMQYEVVGVGDAEVCKEWEDCDRRHAVISGFMLTPAETAQLARYHILDEQVLEGAWVLTKPRVAIDTGMDGLYIIRQDDVVGVLT